MLYSLKTIWYFSSKYRQDFHGGISMIENYRRLLILFTILTQVDIVVFIEFVFVFKKIVKLEILYVFHIFFYFFKKLGGF